MTSRRQRPNEDLPGTFLPRHVADAADRAMEEVLKEDRLLRQYGIMPDDRSQ